MKLTTGGASLSVDLPFFLPLAGASFFFSSTFSSTGTSATGASGGGGSIKIKPKGIFDSKI